MRISAISAISGYAAGGLLIALLLVTRLEAHEPPAGLLAHLTFDGTLADATGNGFGGEAIGKGDTPAAPQFTQGKYGQALRLDGDTAVVVPLDLHFDQYPEVTVTGRIYLETEDARGTVISTGSGDGPQLRVIGRGIYADRPGGGRVEANKALRDGRWQFFAGTWDYRSGTLRLNWRARSMQEKFKTGDLDPPGQDVFIGVASERFNVDLQNALIDDLRIYGRKLSEDDLVGLRLGSAAEGLASEDRIRADVPAGQFERLAIPGDQFACRSIPGDQFECVSIPGDQFEKLAIPGDQFDGVRIPGDQFGQLQVPGERFDIDDLTNPTLIPGDQFSPAAVPGDQFACRSIPGDQFECAQIPGDQFEELAIPGDQFDGVRIPGDQFDATMIPGDQFACRSIPGDQFECVSIPGDQF